MASKAKRDQIVALKTAGISNRNITNQLDVCRRTSTTSTATSTATINGENVRFVANQLCTGFSYEASEAKSSHEHDDKYDRLCTSMHMIFINDLKLTAYKTQSRQLLSAVSKQKRLDRGKRILAEMQRASSGPTKRYSRWRHNLRRLSRLPSFELSLPAVHGILQHRLSVSLDSYTSMIKFNFSRTQIHSIFLKLRS